MFLLIPDLLQNGNGNDLRSWILAFRGFSPKKPVPGLTNEKSGEILIPLEREDREVRIALTSWQTHPDSWTASVTKKLDPDVGRYRRLQRLLNDILNVSPAPHYVIFPELSFPPRWFIRSAMKLLNRGISLIAGVEYIHHSRKRVANQVWASLISDYLGFPSIVILRQDKVCPAPLEEAELFAVAGLKLSPQINKKRSLNQQKPCICHGNFRFGLLICSELTNLRFRSRFRGKVDAVIVPEWNKDVETFSALIESSALGIHAFIVQCNDRQFGDSRIRSPAKEAWERDLVRVKGGKSDYFVVGSLDVDGLRRFQSFHQSPQEGPFKPVPDGFKISSSRRKLPIKRKKSC